MVASEGSSDPRPEVFSPGMAEASAATRLASTVKKASFLMLLMAGLVGIPASFDSRTPISLFCALVCTAIGAWLLWVVHTVDAGAVTLEEVAHTDKSKLNESLRTVVEDIMKTQRQVAADFGDFATRSSDWLRTFIAGVLRTIGKVALGLVGGIAAGTLTVGTYAMEEPEMWRVDRFGRVELPLAPIIFGVGVGLATMAMLLLTFFRRMWSR